MRIEDSPFAFSGTSPVEKLRRNHPPVENWLEDLDLSFLDLLSTVAEEQTQTPKASDAALDLKKAEAAQEAEKKAELQSRPRLTLVPKPSSVDPQAEALAQVDKDMALLNTELSAVDIDYLKQAVIPGLPMLLGSVPIENVFPSEGGQISYKGFGISPKLSELIEKGYKTGRPIRVELDNNSAVVLKIRNGQVSAEFVSTDKTAALVMQQELDDLRHRLALKNLPVGTLEYKYRDPGQGRRDQDEQETYTSSPSSSDETRE